MNLRDFRTGLMRGGMGRFNQLSSDQAALENSRRDQIESAEIDRKLKKQKQRSSPLRPYTEEEIKRHKREESNETKPNP